jgi:hypothetical protein
MFPKTIRFDVQERVNTFAKDGKEWALNVEFDHDRVQSTRWTITTWEKMPFIAERTMAKDIALRAIEVYYNNLRMESFKLEVVG